MLAPTKPNGTTLCKSGVTTGKYPLIHQHKDVLSLGPRAVCRLDDTPYPWGSGGGGSDPVTPVVIGSFSIAEFETLVEVGQSFPSLTFNWSVSPESLVVENGITIKHNGVPIATGIPNTGSKTVTGPFSSNTTANQSFSIDVSYTTENGTRVITKSKIVKWLSRFFYGENIGESVTNEQVTNLRQSDLMESPSSITAEFIALDDGYKYVAVPSTFSIIHFVDPVTKFQVPFVSAGVVTITNQYGINISYKVYRSYNVLNGPVTAVPVI